MSAPKPNTAANTKKTRICATTHSVLEPFRNNETRSILFLRSAAVCPEYRTMKGLAKHSEIKLCHPHLAKQATIFEAWPGSNRDRGRQILEGVCRRFIWGQV